MTASMMALGHGFNGRGPMKSDPALDKIATRETDLTKQDKSEAIAVLEEVLSQLKN